jgi:Family of unknown function (DUF5719)
MSPARFVPAVVVLVALGVIGAVAAVVKPASAPAAVLAAKQVAITAAIRACPPATDGSQDRLALFASSTASGGAAMLSPLTQAGVRAAAAATPSVTTPRSLSLLPVPATGTVSKQQGWSVTATGAMAQGVTAEIAKSNGMSTVSCGEPGSDIWFAGPGQQGGAGQIQLDLMNVDDLAATVTVNVITDAGPAQSADFSGITVPPHSLITESLSSLAGGSSAVAIEVRTSAGRVAASVSESQGHGAASWVPVAGAPSSSLIIPGVPPASANSGLFLVVPGTADARITVTAVTTQGLYKPLGSQVMDLPAESANYVSLTSVGGTAAALRITANVPVVAAVLVPGNGIGAFTAATDPIAQQAVIAGSTTAGGLTASIALTAPAGAAKVRLTETAEGASAGTSQVVSVPAGRTVDTAITTPPGSKRGTPFAVVLTPLAGSGPVYAARIETQGQSTVVSIIPAENAPATISLPPVRDSYDAISP